MTPVERALEKLAYLEPPPTRSRGIPCPTPEHEDRNPSAVHYPDGGWKCFSCGAYGDALNLYCYREGLSVGQALNQLGCFDVAYKPVAKPRPKKVWMPQEVKSLLEASSEFPLRWQAAKLLAIYEPDQQRQDILANWDYLEPLDIPEIWKLTCLIRGLALFRHANPAKAHEVRERNLAVQRLFRELENA
jgi:hypothetical protein